MLKVIPTGKFDSGIEGFVGGYRLRVRYSSVKEKIRGTGSQKTTIWDGVSRQKPIKIWVKGSDGYQAEWTEPPTDNKNSFLGVFETGDVAPAEFDVRDFIEIEGDFPGENSADDEWMRVKDEIEIEFVRD